MMIRIGRALGVGALLAPAVMTASMMVSAVPAQAETVTCAGVSGGTSMSDCGFETPNAGGSYLYEPSGTAWNYTGNAGVAANGGPFRADEAAPEGTQYLFLHGYTTPVGTPSANVSQTITGWQAGAQYTLTLALAERTGGCGYDCGPETFNVLLDGAVIGTFTASSGTFSDVSTAPFSTTAGTHTLAFQALGSGDVDASALVDALRLTSTPGAPVTKDDCKHGGWQVRRGADGTPFKNQGDCVSYVATGGHNPAG